MPDGKYDEIQKNFSYDLFIHAFVCSFACRQRFEKRERFHDRLDIDDARLYCNFTEMDQENGRGYRKTKNQSGTGTILLRGKMKREVC